MSRGHFPVATPLPDHRLNHVTGKPHRGPPLSVSTMHRDSCPRSSETDTAPGAPRESGGHLLARGHPDRLPSDDRAGYSAGLRAPLRPASS